MKAILSDIHGNLEALQAVLADVARQGVDSIYCLGDVIGYGPNPRECLDLAMTWSVVLLGNHDEAVLEGPQGFNPAAKQAVHWTIGELETPLPSLQAVARRWAFLKDLPEERQEGDWMFVHGSPRDPVHEYVFPEDVRNDDKMTPLFAAFRRWCFQGHTHLPGIFRESGDFLTPEKAGAEFRLDEKAMINVGSVGQPRDGNPRACYVLLDGKIIRFRRVAYDFETTVRKIHAIADLSKNLGDRLRVGT